MYQLYYSPGACSLAVHILLRELEAPFQLKLVALAKGEQLQAEYKAVNPKGPRACSCSGSRRNINRGSSHHVLSGRLLSSEAFIAS